MPKERKIRRLEDLTWDDLDAWAGSKVVSRGRNYQQRGRVADLARTEDGTLVAWVDGSVRYATKVDTDIDGTPVSVCTCPYRLDCKHGVAVVLEYLEQARRDQPVPQAGKRDERLELLAGAEQDDEIAQGKIAIPHDAGEEINALLKGKSKAQLVALVHELADRYPEIAHDLADQRRVLSGDADALVERLRREIRDIGAEPAWRNHWDDEGHTPDYSPIRRKLEMLLQEGHADEVLILGEELIITGIRQVEESDDEGETAEEIAACMPVIVQALERASLDGADKLSWAIDAVLEDDYGICEALAEYLGREHPRSSWQGLADRLLERLHGLESTAGAGAGGGAGLDRGYARDRLSDWVMHAMERAGRTDEVIPLCEVEATKTRSYSRLVERLIASGRYEDAERWIREGSRATEERWPGIAAGLRSHLREIRVLEENWPAVAAMQVEEFVRHPSRKAFTECKGAAGKAEAWPTVREYLLDYLEKGELPWERTGWPLPATDLDAPAPSRGDRFPMLGDLIGIAILEKKPDQVLRWYDRDSEKPFGWHGENEDEIATAVQTHAPDRAVAIWQTKAERLIAQVQPNAYREAATYLRKAGAVKAQRGEKEQWDAYLRDLRQTHARKRRLMEILDVLDGTPIVKRR